MGGVHVHPLLRFGVNPSAQHAPAGKCERVRPVSLYHGKFQVAIERRRHNRLPHINMFITSFVRCL